MSGNSRAVGSIQGEANQAGPGRTRDAETARDPSDGLDLSDVSRSLAGDRDAFGDIVSRWQDRIHAVTYRMTGDADLAKDLAQETFLRAWSSLRSFQRGAAFGTWLHAIAVNQTRTEMRRRSAQKRGAPVSLEAMAGAGSGDSETSPSFDPAGKGPAPSDRMEAGERSRSLKAAIAALDPEFREVLVLREFQDLPYEEIAEITGVPVGTVRSRLFRARTELKSRLEGKL